MKTNTIFNDICYNKLKMEDNNMKAYISKLYDFDHSLESTQYILDHKKDFIIPIYQRRYSWEEKQITELFDTLTNNDGLSDIFMGTIQLNHENEEKYEIIDGQQRLTTFILLLEALDIKDSLYKSFKLLNIDTDLDTLLSEENNNPDKSVSQIYKSAKKIIKKYIEDKEAIKENLKRTYFVVLETENRQPSEIITIFNRLNTTGLDLNSTDIFKIDYYDYLKRKYSSEEDWIKKINDCYTKIDEANDKMTNKHPKIPSIKLDWVLTVYKYIIASSIKGNNHKDIFKSNTSFFSELFKHEERFTDETRNLLEFDKFKLLVDVFIATYKIIYQGDFSSPDYLAVCFIEKTRYSFFWILPFFANFYYYLDKKDNHYDSIDSDILEACVKIAHYLIVQSINNDKRINSSISFIFNNILLKFKEKKYDEIKEDVSNETETLKENFINKINGNIFDNQKKCRILCLLSAYLEEIKANTNPQEIYKLLFSDEYHSFDNEHIIAQSKFGQFDEEQKTLLNTLGNIVLLERSPNRSLQDSEVCYKKDTYIASPLVIVKNLGNDIIKEWTIKDVEKRKETENNKILEYLFK